MNDLEHKKKNNLIFERYEIKYLLTYDVYIKLLQKINHLLIPDKYGPTLIRSIYYDTDDYLLIRKSIEKGIYKEKLRVRTYGNKTNNEKVFLEIKKKYMGKVYKRRISSSIEDVKRLINGNNLSLEEKGVNEQIKKEITAFCNHYKNLKPKVMIMYERDAYYEKGTNLRITFDKNISYRSTDLNFNNINPGINIINNNLVLMEIKANYSFPLWLVKILSEMKIYKTSFSKYGLAYKKIIKEKNQECLMNV